MNLYKSISKILALACAASLLLTANGCAQNKPAQSEDVTEATNTSAQEIRTSYGYDSLTDESTKNLYLSIAEMAKNLRPDEVKAEGELSDRQLAQTLSAYKNDYPESFWLCDEYTYHYDGGYTYFNIKLSMENTSLYEAKKSLDGAIDEFLENAPLNGSEYERVVYANDYLADICVYDNEAAKSSEVLGNEANAYGAIVEGKAVCSGYSRAYQLLCQKLGVECVNISGYGDDVPHQWNCVKISDNWYNVDVTWNDSDEAWHNNDYLNLSDRQLSQSHNVNELFSRISDEQYDESSIFSYNTFVPDCISEKYNYYRITSPTLYEFGGENDKEIASSLAEAIESGEEVFSIVVSDSLDFDSTVDKLVDEGYFLNYLDKARLELWWQYNVDTGEIYKKDAINVLTVTLINN